MKNGDFKINSLINLNNISLREIFIPITFPSEMTKKKFLRLTDSESESISSHVGFRIRIYVFTFRIQNPILFLYILDSESESIYSHDRFRIRIYFFTLRIQNPNLFLHKTDSRSESISSHDGFMIPIYLFTLIYFLTGKIFLVKRE